jgi:hypothetical protein
MQTQAFEGLVEVGHPPAGINTYQSLRRFDDAGIYEAVPDREDIFEEPNFLMRVFIG